MNESIILFGAGASGRYSSTFLREKGIEPVCFADNDSSKMTALGGPLAEGLCVWNPLTAQEKYPDATWVATAISRPAATEIRAEIKSMGVKTKPLWECIPVCHGLPPANIRDTLFPAMGDIESQLFFNDQLSFRKMPDYSYQMSPSLISELYFPDFIKRLESEVFVDVGAADGDSITSFKSKWDKFSTILALEPDTSNYEKLVALHPDVGALPWAVGDINGRFAFKSNGDYSSSFGVGENVQCVKLDDVLMDEPTYIKMDIEASEPEALWGARNLLRDHKPVLAICAYHKSEHLWSIPLLIHALQPEYKLYFRRYAEGAFEIVWYAVPPERVK